MKASPRVSVVVPCYNAARYLAEALTSVLGQRPSPEEVIVIDDGSTDDSVAIAERFGPSVRCVRQEQSGAAVARNHGVSLASGELMAFLDADDLWPEDSLASRLALLDGDHTLDMASGLVKQFISPELPDEIRRTLVCPETTSRGRVAGSMLIRRHAFDKVGEFNPAFRIGEAVDWVARADAAGLRNGVADKVVLLRRVHTTNTTTRLRDAKSDYLRVLKASIDRRRAAESGESKTGNG